MKRGRLAAVAALTCLAAAAEGIGAQETALEAFGQPSLYLLDLPVLHLGPADPSRVRPGAWRCTLASAYGSSFSKTWHIPTIHKELGRQGLPVSRAEAELIHARFPRDAVFFADGEVVRSAVSVRVGLSETVSVAAEVPYFAFPSFSWDGVVLGFHSALGFSQAGRDSFPKGRFLVLLQQPGGEMSFSEGRPENRLGDVSAGISWRPPARESGLLLGADAVFKAPTGSPTHLTGSGSWDGGLLLFVGRRAGSWSLGAEGGLVVPGDWKALGSLSTAPFARLLVSASRRTGRTLQIGASLVYEQSALRRNELGGAERGGLEVALGLQWRAAKHAALRLVLVENIAPLGDRADVGLGLALRVR